MSPLPEPVHSELGAGSAAGGYPYPGPPDNPVPHGGTAEAWRSWAERLTVLAAMGVRCVSAGPPAMTFAVEAAPLGPNPNGSVHGGVLAAILDDVSGAAFTRAADPNVLPATATLTVDYLRPAIPPLMITGSVARSGAVLAHCDTAVTSADGRVCCRGRAIMAARSVTR